MVRQVWLIAVVRAFVIGCAVLLVVGCSGGRPEAPQEEQQGYTEATNKEQTRSPEATASEEARCEGTSTYHGPSFLTFHPEHPGIVYTTNDIPGCPNGGLLLGTDKPDQLGGKGGDDEIHGLGAEDYIYGGSGDDVIHGGPGDDSLLYGGKGEDAIYGDDGDDELIDGSGNDIIFCPDRDVVEGCGSLGDRRVDLESCRALGDDDRIPCGEPDGADVIYGGDGNDFIEAYQDGQPDKLYCGKGKDTYVSDPNDYVDSSCEKVPKYKGIP